MGEDLEKVNSFKYLGSAVAKDGNIGMEFKQRISSDWNNWRKYSEVLCD